MDKRPFLFYRENRGIKRKQRQLRERLTSWITVKYHGNYYQYLQMLVNFTNEIFRHSSTTNPHKELTTGILLKLEEPSKNLFQGLVHAITLLNHIHRIETVSGYQTDKEDILNAASLLELDFNREGMLWPKTKILATVLEGIYGCEEFTTRQAAVSLTMTKNATRTHLIALLNVGEIERIRTGRNNTHYYRFVQ